MDAYGQTRPFAHNGRPHGPDRRVQQITHNLLRHWTGASGRIRSIPSP